MYRKTLVLGSTNGNNEKAVLNIESKNGEIFGEIKLYNFDESPDGILTLGFNVKDKIIKAGLSENGYLKYSFRLQSLEQFENFSVALVQIYKGSVKPLLHAATQNASVSEEFLASAVMQMENVSSVAQANEVLEKNGIELEDMQSIENEIDKEFKKQNNCSGCAECKYRAAFYGEEQEEIKETFFSSIEEEVKKLFDSKQSEDILMQIIPNSKWVKINNEDEDSYYVLGLIHENNEVKYICYGTPAFYDENPPKELDGLCEWLPLDANDEKGFGYFITYQDALSGDNVKTNFCIV